MGRFVDRHGARGVIAAGALIGGSSLIALSRVGALWQWDLLWGGGLGLAGAMTLYPVTFTVVANWFHRRRGAALALLTVLGGLASPIFIPLAGALVPAIGWRETLVVFGALQLAIVLPVALVAVRRHPEDLGLHPDGAPSHEHAATRPLGGTVLRDAMRHAAFWTITTTGSIGLLGSNVLFAHQVAYLIGRGIAPEVAATLAGGVGLASLPGRFAFNMLSERLHSQWVLGACQVVLAGGVALLAVATSVASVLLYVVVFGAAFGAGASLAASVRADHFGRRAFGAITAIQGVPALVGAAAGPLAAGWIYDRTGGYELAFAGVAVLYLVSALAMFLTPRPRPLPQPDEAELLAAEPR